MSEPKGRGAARGTREPKGRGAVWTEERGTSDEGRRRSEGGMGRRAGPRRRAGRQSTLALAVLVCGCVFAALAGPALSLHTRSQALNQMLAHLPSTTKAVQVTAGLTDFTSPLVENGIGVPQNMSRSELTESTRELGHGFAALSLPLAPGAWSGLNTKLFVVSGAGPRTQTGAPPELEVLYRAPLTSNAQVAAGAYASTSVPAGMLAVVATTQTAARFGLHPGSLLSMATLSGPVRLFVTAILRESAPGSTFWTQDPNAAMPSLQQPQANSLPYWVGGVFADPDQFSAMQEAFTGSGLELNWEFPLAVAGVNADQAQGLANALNRAVTVTPGLTGALTASADTLTVSSPLISDLTQFLTTQAAIQTVLLLLFVSLIVVGAAVMVLAARMIVARRDSELTMLRARGGSLRQLAAVLLRTAVIAVVPAAALGAGLAIFGVPGDAASSGLGRSLAGIAVAVALAGPPLIAAWQYRKPAPASNRALIAETGRSPKGRTATAWRRPVAEITACAASVAGLVVLRDQGLAAGGGINLYLAITPVLVAIPVVLVMLRLYPLAVRGLLSLVGPRSGCHRLRRPVPGVTVLADRGAARVRPRARAEPGHLRRNGQRRNRPRRGRGVVADHRGGRADRRRPRVRSGQSVGGAGDRGGPRRPGGGRGLEHQLDHAVRPVGGGGRRGSRELRGGGSGHPVPGVPGGQDRHRVGRRPAGWSTAVRRHGAGARLARRGGPPRPRSDAADFAVCDGTNPRAGGRDPDGTPAQPGGGTFVVMPSQTLPGPTGQPAPSMVLVSGSSIDRAQLTAVADKVIPGNYTTYRTAVLASLASSPLQHGAGAHHRPDHRDRGRVRPVHRDPRPGPRVGGA